MSRIPPVLWMIITIVAVVIGFGVYTYWIGAWDALPP
jgi:hypothetical protein